MVKPGETLHPCLPPLPAFSDNSKGKVTNVTIFGFGPDFELLPLFSMGICFYPFFLKPKEDGKTSESPNLPGSVSKQ